MNSSITSAITESLKILQQFQTKEGLFKTFRAEYSEEKCPNDYINEKTSVFIDTKYDHSFILEIVVKLRGYAINRLQDILLNGLNVILKDAIVNDLGVYKTLRWRYYNIDHQGQGKILPDIDTTGRNLILIERYRKIFGDSFLQSLGYPIIHNPYNFRQLGWQIHPVDREFRPDSDESSYFGMLTHFGLKPDNDVDPVCNIVSLSSALLFLDNDPRFLSQRALLSIQRTLDYLLSFLESERCVNKIHEYYEPIAVFYNYARFFELCENLQYPLKNAVHIDSSYKKRLRDLMMNELEEGKWKNPLEKAFGASSLLILGNMKKAIRDTITDIIESRKDGYWNAFRFYRQRHPHRIFGSRGLTTAACLEALDYWNSSNW